MNETLHDPASLRGEYEKLRQVRPRLRARDLAAELKVSEAELVDCRCGDETRRLSRNMEKILCSCERLGEVMALTRNEHCVHERHGAYLGARFFSHGGMRMGLLTNPDIDLRLFMDKWEFPFAVNEDGRHSLQFFGGDGKAVHKIYLTPKSDAGAYHALVDEFAEADGEPLRIAAPAPAPAPRPDAKIDVAAMQREWDALKDPHDFHPMLERLKVARMQALRLAGEGRARRLGNDAMRTALARAAADKLPIMIFVSSDGCIQIHTGAVRKLVDYGEWHNVLDPAFNLHLRENAIAHSWLVRKPYEGGLVTSLELFDEREELILLMFGACKPGEVEPEQWRTLTAALPTC